MHFFLSYMHLDVLLSTGYPDVAYSPSGTTTVVVT
jgi:hypothetical protein